MSNPAITGIPQAVSLRAANIGVGSYIINDYVITITEVQDGYTMTIRKGSQEQTIHLTELDQEHVDASIQAALAEAKESGDFDGPKGDKGDPGISVTVTGSCLNIV